LRIRDSLALGHSTSVDAAAFTSSILDSRASSE
jgi:hypothetical protein